MNTLYDFLKQTKERFDSLEYDREHYYIDYLKIKICIRTTSDGYAISEVHGNELARLYLKDAKIFYIEDLCIELSKLLRTPIFYSWLDNKNDNYNKFSIVLYNGLPFEQLVDVGDGVLRFDCWRTIEQMKEHGDI
jgi:hypothetical protein